MSESADLSPWAHPKAQAWFEALFRRTNLLMSLEDELNKPDDQLMPEIARLILAFSILLGRPEIWPESEFPILNKVVVRTKEISQKPASSSIGKPISLAEHQLHKKATGQIAQEIELIRRRVGVSVRKSKVSAPATWQPFWS